MTPRVATKTSWSEFSAREVAEKSREVDRERVERLAAATSLGDRVVRSAEFKQLWRNAPRTDHGPVTNRDVFVAQLEAGETKALIRSGVSTSAGAFLTSEQGTPAPVPARPLRVLDLVREGTMATDSITFARQDTYSPAVTGAVAEATSTTTGTKPEATASFAIVTAQANTYASWIPVTRRSLSDATELRTLVDTRLTQDATQALEAALLAQVNSDAGQSVARGADSHSLAALKGITALRNADAEPSAVVVTPATFESIATSATPAGGLTVDASGVQRLWGVPILASASAPATVALIADWLTAAAVWYRSTDVLITNTHESHFVRNISVLLSELRAAHATTAPRAVVKVTGM
jgi:HK97 family phage major capsid protein